MYRQTLKRWICVLSLAALLVGVLPGGFALADSTATVCAASAAVYSSPYSSTAKVLGKLSNGQSVTVRAVSGTLAKVVYNGKTGYMDATKLDCGSSDAGNTGSSTPAAKPTPTPAPSTSVAAATATVSANSLVVYKAASKAAARYGTLRKGVVVQLLKVNGSWAAIKVSGKTGYCSAAGLSTLQEPVVSNPVDSPTAGGTVAPSPTSNAGGTGGSITAGSVAVTTERLRFYKSASTSAAYYGTFKTGVTVKVQAVSGQWAKVTYSGKTGCVLLGGLALSQSAEAAPTPTPQPTTGSSGESSDDTHQALNAARLYQKPSASSKVLKTLTQGSKITVNATSGGWLKVVYGGVNCYALDADFIEIGGGKTTGLVVVSSLKVYAQASLSASSYGTIAEGTTIDIYAQSGGWGKILYNNKKAFVLMDKVVTGAASYQALKSGSTGPSVLSLQSRLEKLGYFDGVPAGNYGSITTAAVRRFQTQVGLTVTGVANAATQAALFSSGAEVSAIVTRTLTNGSTGDYVTRLQTRLLYKNYYTGSVDGEYGADTVAAVTLFQKTAGLTQNGVADSATLKALFAPGAPIAPAASKPVGSNGTPSLDAPNEVSDNEDIETVIRYALAQLGKPYVYGTSGPNSFDCSGLTYFCFKKVGVSLPRSAYDVGYATTLGERIEYADLKRGDIVCFNTISDSDLSDHVGIYLGDGKFIHAPHTGSDVIVASMTTSYYTKNFSWGRRPIK